MDPQQVNPIPPVEPQAPAPPPIAATPEQMPPQPVQPQPAPVKRSVGLGVVALILSLFIPIVSLVLAAIGLAKSRGNGGLKALCIVAICVSLFVGSAQSWLLYSAYKGWQRVSQDLVIVDSNSMLDYTVTDDQGVELMRVLYPAKTTENSIVLTGGPKPDNEKGTQLDRAIKSSDGFYKLNITATANNKSAYETTGAVTSTEDLQTIIAKDPKLHANSLTLKDVSFAVATSTLTDYKGQKAVLLEASQGQPTAKDLFGEAKTSGFAAADTVRLKALFIVKNSKVYSVTIIATEAEWLADATLLNKTYDSIEIL